MKKISFTRDAKESMVMCDYFLRHWEDGIVILHSDNVCAAGTFKDVGNKEFIEANNIEYIYFDTGGGCIVFFPDDLTFAHFSTDCNDNFYDVITEKLKNYLISKGLNASRDTNDILVDGYKVFSTARHNYNQRVLCTAIHVSINCDAELVNKICLKPMHKKPRGLSEYGITSNEILELIVNEYNNGD